MDGKPQRDLYIALGKRIRAVRRGALLTQAQLASILHLSRTSVTNIEKGRQQILVHTLYAIAMGLGVGVSELLPESDLVTTDRTREDVPHGISQDEWKYIRPLVSGTRTRKRKPGTSRKEGKV